jgi:cytochrome c oxidase assembly factor 5
MPSSCKDIRAALAACLQSSDCIMIHHNQPLECLSPPLLHTLPEQCQQLKRGFRDCKRGMVDMRKRFRGNQPISTSLEIEGQGGVRIEMEKPKQLYGGKEAFGVPVKEVNEAEKEGLGLDGSKTRGL